MMKIKAVLIVVFFLHQMVSFGQSWSIGAAGIYGDDIQNVGAHVRGYYNLKNNKVCLGPEFSRFANKTETHNGETVTTKLSEINFNIHYIFELTEKFGVYPLTGVNLSLETEEIEVANEFESDTVSELGANLGFGVHKIFDNVIVFAEYDHLFSELSQNSFLLGVFYTFGSKSHSEEE